MKKILLIFLVVLNYSYAQLDDATNLYNTEMAKSMDLPNSPEASAFVKYGDFSTNMYTGTPEVSVPIYVHQGSEMSLPITLTYDA